MHETLEATVVQEHKATRQNEKQPEQQYDDPQTKEDLRNNDKHQKGKNFHLIGYLLYVEVQEPEKRAIVKD